MARNDIDRIAAMLDDDAPERRMAAVIVLGELKAKGPKVSAGLLGEIQFAWRELGLDRNRFESVVKAVEGRLAGVLATLL